MARLEPSSYHAVPASPTKHKRAAQASTEVDRLPTIARAVGGRLSGPRRAASLSVPDLAELLAAFEQVPTPGLRPSHSVELLAEEDSPRPETHPIGPIEPASSGDAAKGEVRGDQRPEESTRPG